MLKEIDAHWLDHFYRAIMVDRFEVSKTAAAQSSNEMGSRVMSEVQGMKIMVKETAFKQND